MDSLLNIKSHLLNSNTDKSLDIKSVFKVDEEVQTLIRNSDGMAVLMNLQETLYDGGREKLKPEITAIMKSCNDLIFWFVKNSEVNQTIAFDYIKWLVERIDDNINSSKVVKAILEGNKGNKFKNDFNTNIFLRINKEMSTHLCRRVRAKNIIVWSKTRIS